MEGLLALLGQLCKQEPPAVTVSTAPGKFEATPDAAYWLLAPGPAVISAVTGPDSGAAAVEDAVGATNLPWRSPSVPAGHASHTWGDCASLYDRDPITGKRAGEPVADCYGAVTYEQGAVLALADGVNWGRRPKLAARGAVHGFLAHMHAEVSQKKGSTAISSDALFAHVRAAVLAAQAAVLKADGTLTTLVAAVVAPRRRGGGHCVLTVAVGDSPSYVWRARQGRVEELSFQPPLHGFHRDPRVCPGCLGYAIGDSPDLSNIIYSISRVEEGDIVYLASDGVADNFDPIIRKLASPRPSCGFAPAPAQQKPAAFPAAHAAAGAPWSPAQQPGVAEAGAAAAGAAAAAAAGSAAAVPECRSGPAPPLSPSGCHMAALEGMARLLEQAAAEEELERRRQAQAGAGAGGEQSAATAAAAAAALGVLTPAGLVGALIAFASRATERQRALLEGPERPEDPDELADVMAGLPGKMDHASTVAYRVGSRPPLPTAAGAAAAATEVEEAEAGEGLEAGSGRVEAGRAAGRT